MKKIAVIDIKGEEEINSVLNASDIFAIDAFRCENLDAWIPDIGMTDYPERNIYRSRSIIDSGIKSKLKHRFLFETAHLGTKYFGVILYDSCLEETNLEIWLRNEMIGKIETIRHDNRRHLLVIDKKVEFTGSMDVLQIYASGGTCRIEKLVIMSRKPKATSYKPQINRVTAKHTNENFAVVDFITSVPTICEIEICLDGSDSVIYSSKENKYLKLHNIKVSDLDKNLDHIIKIKVTEMQGQSTFKKINLLKEDVAKKTIVVDVPIEILPCLSQTTTPGNLTFGVPIPKDRIKEIENCNLIISGKKLPAQSRIHSLWQGGSARWILVDSHIPFGVNSHDFINSQVRFNDPKSEKYTGLDCQDIDGKILIKSKLVELVINKSGNDILERVEYIDDSGLQKNMLTDTGKIQAVLSNGLCLYSGEIESAAIEEAGPLRATILLKIPINDNRGITHFMSSIRISVYNESSYIRFNHRLYVVSPVLSPASGGGDIDRSDAYSHIFDAIDGLEGEQRTIIGVRSYSMLFSLKDSKELLEFGSKYFFDKKVRIIQNNENDYCIEYDGKISKTEGRNNGTFQIRGSNTSLVVAIKDFWQKYPKALSVDKNGLCIELLPNIKNDKLSCDENELHRLYFWKKGDTYRLKAGLAITNDFVLDFDNNKPILEDHNIYFNKCFVRPNIDWLNNSDVWSKIASKNGAHSEEYESFVDRAYVGWLQNREELKQYGFMNFGDWYGEGKWCWGNNEYDSPYAHYMEFLRGGNTGWAKLATEGAEHLSDIDTVNYSKDITQIGAEYMHIAGHAGGFLPPYFLSKMAGSSTQTAHMWVEGPVFHYLLTGDESFKETLDRIASWVLNGVDLNNYDFGNCRICGWHITHLCALARLTNDSRYINAAAIIVERVLERQAPQGGWVHLLTEPHCNCYPPRHSGEAGFMVGVLLSALKKYYEITGDQRVEKAIVGGAKWLILNTYDRIEGNFTYTNCTTLMSKGNIDSTMYVIEGLIYAYKLSGDEMINNVIKKAIADMKRYFLRIDLSEYSTLGYGKKISMLTRYAPIVLNEIGEINIK